MEVSHTGYGDAHHRTYSAPWSEPITEQSRHIVNLILHTVTPKMETFLHSPSTLMQLGFSGPRTFRVVLEGLWPLLSQPWPRKGKR